MVTKRQAAIDSPWVVELSVVMYAIISDGGRQYKVEEGTRLEVDFRELPEGSQVTFDRVLAVSSDGDVRIGTPVVAGATVTAEVVDPEKKGVKLIVQKFRRRKNSRRKTGHRQKYTSVVVNKISVG